MRRLNMNIIGTDDNNLDEDLRELIMELSPAYIQWREETLEKGRVEGEAQAKAGVAINLLKAGKLSDLATCMDMHGSNGI